MVRAEAALKCAADPTEGPRAVGHRPEAGGSAAA